MQYDGSVLDPSGILRRLVVARHTGAARPAQGHADVLVNKGGKKGLLQYAQTPLQYRTEHVECVREFSAYVLTAMHLAGLDRRYGALPAELRRIEQAADPDSPNSILDYSLMRRMEDTDMALLQLELDSAARAPVLAAEVARIHDAVTMSFLMGKEYVGASGFEYLVGATEPSEMLQQVGGSARRLLTPSLHAYLTLTLFDPYAYGVSSQRAIMTFIASVLIRQQLRSKVDEDKWPMTKVDEEIMQHDDIAAATSQAGVLSREELATLRQRFERMPAFANFSKCLHAHSSRRAHETNPDFHSLYTVLKASYLLHFAATWLSARVTEQLNEERVSDFNRDAPEQGRYFISATDMRVLETAEAELVGLCGRYERAQPHAKTGAAADLLVYALRASEIVTSVEATSRTGVSDEWRPYRLFVKTTALPGGFDDAANAIRDAPATTVAAIRALLTTHGSSVGSTNVPLMVQEDMTQRSISRADAVLAIEDGEYVPAEVRYVAYALLLYVRYLRAAHDEATGDKARYEEQLRNHYFQRPEVLRLYRLRPALLFIGRLHSFLRRFYSGTGDAAPEPTIVTMLRRSGWQAARGPARSPQRTLDRAFESLTYAMAHGLVYCHTGMSDAARNARFAHHLHKLLNRNLQLMSLLQRHALSKVPACHVFVHAARTQFTLPAAVAAALIPTTEVAPLDWSPADLLYRDGAREKYDPGSVRELLRAVVGDGTFQRIENEQLPSVRLVQQIARPLATQRTMAQLQTSAARRRKQVHDIMRRLTLANTQA